MEKRKDCPDFEPKEFQEENGVCQTDGHYLCGNCKHIASFNTMELGDLRMSYYRDLEVKAQKKWDEEFERMYKGS